MPTPSDDAEALREKLRAWREGGGMNVTWGGRHGYGEGRQDFHDSPSKFAKEKQAIAEMRAAGIAFDRPPR